MAVAVTNFLGSPNPDVIRPIEEGALPPSEGRPDLLVLDEPTAALDHGNQTRVLQLLTDLSRRGFGIISTTHNPNHAILLGGSAGVLTRTGRFHTGPVGEVIREDLLSRVYETDLRVVYVEQLGRAVCETPAMTNP